MSEGMQVKILITKSTSKIIYLEANSDFVDMLCTLLTTPLGCIAEILSKFDNIGSAKKTIKTESANKSKKRSMNMTLAKPTSTTSPSVVLLSSIKEIPKQHKLKTLEDSWKQMSGTGFVHLLGDGGAAEVRIANRCQNCGEQKHDCVIVGSYYRCAKCRGNPEKFMQENSTFMVTGDLRVRPISVVEVVSLLGANDIDIKDLRGLELIVNKEMILALVNGILNGSDTALDDMFADSLDGNQFVVIDP
eukprot:CAMPEP_0196585768 /NCGR_PEP_ID=MMETSP1081-20130531/51927_1 /TAXON_ID=36882 /ORGANISM="Pyramimonas amylifera, Strain CCMP720" /LENGTH=246 /DNA_ID=CAMNT_0041907425 /DNA_START=128 /DNA_END=871 /DNA_ORIENTATION=+